MSKEKKAIEYFKKQIPKLENIIDWNETFYINPTQSKILKNSLITIIDLIDKQQKEIEALKTKLAIETIDNKYNQEERDEETIPRYKIREKIKELEITRNSSVTDNGFTIMSVVISNFKELLEEN